MDNKEKLIAKYGDMTKTKKDFKSFCEFIEQKLNAKQLNFDLVLDPMRKFLYYNIKSYAEMYGLHLQENELDIILYILPKDGVTEKYYNEAHTSAAIYGYNDYIYVILIKQLEYYMESNCGVLFIDLAIERGISDEDKKNRSVAYIEYLSRIEAKENGYYKNGVQG